MRKGGSALEHLATTTRQGGEIGVDLQPVDIAGLNFSYVHLLAKNDDTDLYHLIEKPEHTFKDTLNLEWSNYGLIHYLRKLKESKEDVVHSVQGSSGLMNEAKRKKHRNRFRATDFALHTG